MYAIGGRIYLLSDDFAAAIEKLAELSKSLKGRIRTEQTAAPSVVKNSSRPSKTSKTPPARCAGRSLPPADLCLALKL